MRFFIFLTIFTLCNLRAEWLIQQFSGRFSVSDPVIESFAKSSALERLKGIDQSGPVYYLGLIPAFSRYDHSVGVFWLLRYKAKTGLYQQVAGLLHDASHTAFSHVADHVFRMENQQHSYQDAVHLKHLKDLGVARIAKEYFLDFAKLDPDLEEYKALEQNLPDLCADRIQYIVHTGLIYNDITIEQANNIYKSLSFSENKWFFNDQENAKVFALLSLKYTKEFWGSAWNFAINTYFAEVLLAAVKAKIINIYDFTHGTDFPLWEKLSNATLKKVNPQVYLAMQFLKINKKNIFALTTFGEGEYNTRPKFRGVDPWVKGDNSFFRLTELDKSYAQAYLDTKNWCNKGFGIKLKWPKNVKFSALK